MWQTSTIYVIVSVSVAALIAVPSLAMFIIARSRRVNLKMLQAERDRLDACFESSPVGIVLFNESRKVIRANSAAASLVKGRISDLINQSQGDALKCAYRTVSPQGCGFSAECQLCSLRKTLVSVLGEDRRIVGVEVPMTLVRDGAVQKVWLRIGAQPFMLESKRYVIVALDDITEVKQTLEKLQQTSAVLERMNDEVRAACKTKSQFLANMSHEIRTPLNGIIGMTDLLLSTKLEKEQKNYVDVIHSSGEALLSVVNDILDFSKIEADKIVLEHEAFDLQHCLEEVLHFVAPVAAKKNLELVCQLETGLQSLWIGDSDRLRQILVNLVGNAVKFTERGEVVIAVTGNKVEERRWRLTFSVRDTGVGITPEQQKRLFQSFSQVDTSSVRRFGGTGLGLVISKRLCELMGGTITVESKGVPGRGSVFSFTIMAETSQDETGAVVSQPPALLQGKRVLIVDANASCREELKRQAESWRMVAQAVASGSAASDILRGEALFDVAIVSYGMPDVNGLKLVEEVRQVPSRRSMRVLLLSSLGECVAGWERLHISACLSKPVLPVRLQNALVCALAVQQMEAAHGEPVTEVALNDEERPVSLRVLVAEDNAVNQKVVLGFLERLGYHADVVTNGLDAVEAVKRTRYDVVLMDGQMPEMDGEQATVLIRKEVPPDKQPWVVAMTANVLKGDRERYLAAGMNEYLSKPIRADALASVLRGVPRMPAGSRSSSRLEIE